MNSLTEIAAFIEERQRFLVTTHMRPDGDAIGSTTGLVHCLKELGKDPQLVMLNAPDERFSLLWEGLRIDPLEALSPPFDAVITLDCGDFERTGYVERIRALGVPIVNIDHHASNPSFGDLNYVDTASSSTAELVSLLITAGGWKLVPRAARSLYAGICTDTRFFQNAALRSATFHRAAELLDTGFDRPELMAILANNKSFMDLKVLAVGLANAQSELDGRLVWSRVRRSEFEALGATTRHAWSAGIYSSLNSCADARATVCFVEDEDGGVFSEFRSKHGVNVQRVAGLFGGGGHLQASGCRLPSTDGIPDVLQALREAILSAEE